MVVEFCYTFFKLKLLLLHALCRDFTLYKQERMIEVTISVVEEKLEGSLMKRRSE